MPPELHLHLIFWIPLSGSTLGDDEGGPGGGGICGGPGTGRQLPAAARGQGGPLDELGRPRAPRPLISAGASRQGVAFEPGAWQSVLRVFLQEKQTVDGLSICMIASIGYNSTQTIFISRLRILSHGNVCHASPCRAVPCHAMPCRAVPWCAVPCRAVPTMAYNLGD